MFPWPFAVQHKEILLRSPPAAPPPPTKAYHWQRQPLGKASLVKPTHLDWQRLDPDHPRMARMVGVNYLVDQQHVEGFPGCYHCKSRKSSAKRFGEVLGLTCGWGTSAPPAKARPGKAPHQSTLRRASLNRTQATFGQRARWHLCWRSSCPHVQGHPARDLGAPCAGVAPSAPWRWPTGLQAEVRRVSFIKAPA